MDPISAGLECLVIILVPGLIDARYFGLALMTAFTEFISSWAAVRPSNCLNYPSDSLSLPLDPPIFPARFSRPVILLVLVGSPSPLMYVQLSTSTWSWTTVERTRLGSGKIEKDIYYLVRARDGLSPGWSRNLKKGRCRKGAAMICAGRGYPRVGTACDRRKNARNKGVTRRGSRVCVCACEHKRRRGRG